MVPAFVRAGMDPAPFGHLVSDRTYAETPNLTDTLEPELLRFQGGWSWMSSTPDTPPRAKEER